MGALERVLTLNVRVVTIWTVHALHLAVRVTSRCIARCVGELLSSAEIVCRQTDCHQRRRCGFGRSEERNSGP